MGLHIRIWQPNLSLPLFILNVSANLFRAPIPTLPPSLLALILSSIHTALEVGWFPFSAVLRPNKLELAAAA